MNECPHLQHEIRWRKTSNGVRQAWRQCLVCFQVVGTALKHTEAPSDAPAFDEQAREDHWQQISDAYHKRWADEQARRDLEYQHRCSERREQYLDYLDTPQWRRKREAVLERDNYVCQAALDCCAGRASQAHHLTYDRIFDEPLFDLVAVCRACHERLHSDKNEK